MFVLNMREGGFASLYFHLLFISLDAFYKV